MANPYPDLQMTNIEHFTDADVLCGRGGTAQKHVGNKTYRTLVNLNKQLYASCRTTEKIKISRSIVAAIREQKGRFLEKDPNTGLFYDITDKKAVEKTSQALREGQPKLKQKLAKNVDAPKTDKRQSAADTRTSVPTPSQPYQPPPAAPQLQAMAQAAGVGMNDPYATNNDGPQNEYVWDPHAQQQQMQLLGQPQRPTLAPSAQSDMSIISDISASFRHMMNDEQTRSSFDRTFQDAIKEISVDNNDPFYYGEDEGYANMEPPPRRQMLETMDSFRRQLMGIASPQNSTMSLASTIGGDLSAFGGSSHQQMNVRNSVQEARTNPADIVLPPRQMNAASDDYQFRAEPRQNAIDDLLSVGGLSKLSLMSGVSEATLDVNGSRRTMVSNGVSELTLDPTLLRASTTTSTSSGSRGRMGGHNMGISTRSTAMSEVSALDFLQEEEIEDDL
eukprot:scaffold294_cov221-Amphora_coffeaeformis.AAC.65